jgi:hypothetical protein
MRTHGRDCRKFLTVIFCAVSAATFCAPSLAKELRKVEYPYDTDLVSKGSIFLTNLYNKQIRGSYYKHVTGRRVFPCKWDNFDTTCVTINTLSSVDVSGTGRFLATPFPLFL